MKKRSRVEYCSLRDDLVLLSSEFQRVGNITDSTDLIVTNCNSGMSSCSLAFAARLAGFENVKVFMVRE